MFNKEMFGSRKDKMINVFTVGGGSYRGIVVECSDRFLTLSDRWSSKHFIALDHIQSFWCDDDKPTKE